jgi:hypothetical protein
VAKTTKKRTSGSKAKAVSVKPARERPNRSVSKADPPSEARTRSGTKQERAIEMLRSDDGASIAALMEATGWQQHSVRGFLAGVVRKRLGLPLESTKVDGARVYRIAEGRATKPRSGGDRQASSSA